MDQLSASSFLVRMTRAFGCRERENRRPLTLFLQQIYELGLVLGLAAGAWRIGQHARGFGLAHALACVGLDGLCGRETGWLAFCHSEHSRFGK